jgi:RsiW-degrading membrane proteinase PrsW (M82 family)
MSADLFILVPLGLSPVLILLGVLLYLDSFRLVSIHIVLQMLLLGAVLAVAAYFINGWLIELLSLDFGTYTRYGAPLVEEGLKCGALIYLFQRNRIAFLVDAALIGIAIGSGFAVAENIYQLYHFHDNIGVWIVRGFGTAIMHGGVTAIFGVLSQAMSERHTKFHALMYVPGFVLAVALHSMFNHVTDPPLIAATGTLIATPIILFLVFGKSEHKIHDWLVHDYESHEHLLKEIEAGDYSHSEAARFIVDMSTKLDKDVKDAMFEYIKLHARLVMRAEEVLLSQENGKKISLNGDVKAHFDRFHALVR